MNAPSPRKRSLHLRPGSLAAQVMAWLEANPEEELTAADIAVKFNTVRMSVCGQLRAAVSAGWLERTNDRPSLFRLPRRAGRRMVYLSGPMTGCDSLNFPAFHAEAKRLRGLGYEVVNPAELNPIPGTPWHACLRADLKALLDCDAIVMLPGWEGSAGAHLEMHVAHRVGLEILQAREVVA